MILKKFAIGAFSLFAFMSCNSSLGKNESSNTTLELRCEQRNWQVTVSLPNLATFVPFDSMIHIWPIGPESLSTIYRSKVDPNNYIGIKYCEYHLEGDESIEVLADYYQGKLKAAGAKELSFQQNTDSFIAEHLVYNDSIGHEIYLITRRIKTKHDVITLVGMNLDGISDTRTSKMYSILIAAQTSLNSKLRF